MALLVAPWVEQALSAPLHLTQAQQLGFAFLLGSFVVATLSDIKRLSAQREFLEVWVLFTVGVLVYDVSVLWMDSWVGWQVAAIKWSLILALGLMSWRHVGPIFRLARADVFACAAAAALLPPLLILAFWIVLKLVAIAIRPLLARGRTHWPFMPVVTVAVLVVLAVGLFLPEDLVSFSLVGA